MIRVFIVLLLLIGNTPTFAQSSLRKEAQRSRKAFDQAPAKSKVVLPTKVEAPKKEEADIKASPKTAEKKAPKAKGLSRAEVEKIVNAYFYKGSLEKLEEEARKVNKPYFIDFYTDWCAPCKQMDKETFTNPAVMNYIKQNFIAYKMNGEKKGAGTAKLNKVKSYPTFIFFDRDSHEIGRIESYIGTQAFLSKLKKLKPRVPNTRFSDFR